MKSLKAANFAQFLLYKRAGFVLITNLQPGFSGNFLWTKASKCPYVAKHGSSIRSLTLVLGQS